MNKLFQMKIDSLLIMQVNYKVMSFYCTIRFMLKRTKPGLVSSNSSARLLEDVLVDKDNHNHLIQGSRVRASFLDTKFN